MLCVMQLSAVFFGLGGVLVDGSDDAVRVASPPVAQAKPGAVELIDALDARGLIAAVVTNSLSGPARLLLESVNLLPHALVGVDDVALPKPAPDMILRACEVTGVPPWEVLVVGDTDVDRRAAESAGCLFAGVGTGGHFTIGNLTEVLSIVEGAGPSS